MPTRALPDLIARIRIDSTGVDAALMNLTKSFGKANLEIAAAGAAIGVAVLAGKSMVDISEKWQGAQLSLTQAVQAHNAAIGTTSTLTAAASKAITKAQDSESKAQDALTIAHNSVIKAQIAYTDAVKKHTAKSEEAYKAAMNLQDAQIHLRSAQDALTDSTQALAAAQAGIGQKVTGTAINLQAYQSQIDDFIKTNRRFIEDQSQVVEGYAALIREGVSVVDTNKDMAIALNIAAVQGSSLSDAVTMLQAAEAGRTIGLKKLVGITLESIPATASLAEKQAIVAHNMDIVAAAYKNGTATITPLQQQANDLNNTWQTFAEQRGPALVGSLTSIVEYSNDSLIPSFEATAGKLNDIGAAADQLVAKPSWGQLDKLIFGTGQFAWLVPGGPADRFLTWLWNIDNASSHGGNPVKSVSGAGWLGNPVVGPQPSGPDARGNVGRASGGSVLPNSIYTVGETEQETLVMGASGGVVIPSGKGRGGGGGAINVYVNNPRADAWQIANEIAWAKKSQRI